MTEQASQPQATAARRPLLDLLVEGGGELATGDAAAVVASFGDPGAEYRALSESAAVVDDTGRVLIRVTEGRKEGRAHDTLSGLLTNDFAAVEPDAALYSFLLTAKGGPVAVLRAIRREEEDWLDLPACCREGTLRHFEKYLPPLFARYEVDEGTGRLGVVGPAAEEALGAATAELEAERLGSLEGASARVAGEEAFVLRREAAEGPGFDLYVPLEAAAAVWERLQGAVDAVGGRPAGRRAREVRRVELGLPAYGAEITEDTLPHETGQTGRAVSFEKGCYTGQEVVVRVEHRGQVNRHLRGLEFEETLPEPGAALYHGDRERGTVTTPVRSPRYGPIALGYVRREVQPGSRLSLEAGGEEPGCRVRELPFRG